MSILLMSLMKSESLLAYERREEGFTNLTYKYINSRNIYIYNATWFSGLVEQERKK
jgi:hypothetical protein